MGFIVGAQDASHFHLIHFPCCGQQYRAKHFWASISRVDESGWIELMVKTWLIYMVAVVVGVAFPRFRVDQAIRFFFRVPTLIGILAVVYAQTLLNS